MCTCMRRPPNSRREVPLSDVSFGFFFESRTFITLEGVALFHSYPGHDESFVAVFFSWIRLSLSPAMCTQISSADKIICS